ncbi:MAG: MFS transporter [Thermoleophilaceae bacterium]
MPVLMAGVFLIVLDFFVVNVALPAIQADLHASTGAVEWVVAGYGLAFAVLIITAGRLADQFGRRRMLIAGLAGFTIASAACGLAPSAGALIGFRVVQGAAAAAISPAVLSIMGVTYQGAARARALSIYGITMGLASAGGQLIGGALVTADVGGIGWRAIFLVNLPVGIAAVTLAPRLVEESRPNQARPLDPVGMALVTTALAAIVLPLIEGRTHGWPVWTWASFAAGIALLAGLVAQQRSLARTGGAPLFDPVLFRTRAFGAGLATQLVYWCTQASGYLFLALYLEQGRGLDALDAGLLFTFLAGAYVVTSLRAPALTMRYGRSLIATGACTLGAGYALLLTAVAVIGTGGSVAALVPGLLVVGAGQGLCITPLTTTVLAHADPQRAGVVSGALSTMQQAGNALGVAITGVIFFGALDGGYGHAFALALAELVGLLVVVAGLTRLLPPPRRAAPATSPTVASSDVGAPDHQFAR